MELVEFLNARYDERAEKAHAAGGIWWAPPDLPGQVHDSGGVNIEAKLPSFAAHIALNDPTHVLDEVESARELLRLHKPRHDGYTWICDTCSYYDPERGMRVNIYAPCQHLKILARPYRKRKDFDPAWLED